MILDNEILISFSNSNNSVVSLIIILEPFRMLGMK